jgi:hypothetical protein
MINPRNLEKGKFYRVEFNNQAVPNWYTVQASSDSIVNVLTKNGRESRGSGMVTTASDIFEINESYARTGKLDPKHNEEALVLLLND